MARVEATTPDDIALTLVAITAVCVDTFFMTCDAMSLAPITMFTSAIPFRLSFCLVRVYLTAITLKRHPNIDPPGALIHHATHARQVVFRHLREIYCVYHIASKPAWTLR
jgi:hypothetical protein